MLSLQALQSGQVLANLLDERGLIIRPVAGTVLANLVKSSCNDHDYVWGDKGNRTVDLSTIADMTNRVDTVTGMSEQNIAMSEVVNFVADAVTKHLLVARTVVAPAVEDLVHRSSALLEQALASSLTQLEIKIWKFPAPMLEPSLVDSFMRAQEIPAEEFNVGMRMSPASVHQIREYAISGVPSLDEAVAQFFTNLGDEQITTMFEVLFTPKVDALSASQLFSHPTEGLTSALFAFILARKLWDNPPEGVDMSEAAFENQMVRMRDQAALFLIRELRRQERDELNGIMVRSYTRTSVEVNEPIYRKWINDGGNNDVLFGNVLSNNPRMTTADIAMNTEEYTKIWSHFCLINRTTEANKRFTTAKQLVSMEFMASIRDLDHDALPLQDRETVVKLFNEALACTKESELADPYSWILRLLCESRFRQTDAFRILDGINQVKAHSPDVDVREAAAVAAIEYIATWMASQMVVDSAIK